MTEEARAARNAYLRKWAREHPEKIREYAARHWEKKAAQMKEYLEGKEETDEDEDDRVR